MKAIYARVSTDKQRHDAQLQELEEYCARRGWRDVVTFTDTISGSKFSREGFDKLMKQAGREVQVPKDP
jgi:DNA invertase Pin-like site-specific DNA recombinase